MLWLAINFHQLPLDVFFLSGEQDNTNDFVVVDNERVVYCNRLAFNNGLEAGMKVSTAFALSNKIVVKERSLALEKQTLNQLATQIYGFSSQVCLYNDKTILVELEASLKLFSCLSFLLKKLAKKLGRFNLSFSIGLAKTPKAAFLLSACQYQTLNQLVTLSEQYELAMLILNAEERLAQLPVDLIALDPSVSPNSKILQLKKMGIKAIGQLINLPVSAIGRRFGQSIIHYLYRLKGSVNDPQVLFSLPEHFFDQRIFINGLQTIEQVLFPAKPMLANLAGFLKSRCVMTDKIVWKLICFNGDEITIKLMLSSEVQSTEQLMVLTRLKFQTVNFDEPVEMIQLIATSFLEHAKKQSFLMLQNSDTSIQSDSNVYSNAADAGYHNIASLRDKLHARLDRESCLSVSTSNDYLPENISQIKTSASSLDLRFNQCEWNQRQPLWLFPIAEPVQTFGDGENVHFNYKGQLEKASKSERIESGWWENSASRCYVQMVNSSGIRYWVYRDLNNGNWFVHGVF